LSHSCDRAADHRDADKRFLLEQTDTHNTPLRRRVVSVVLADERCGCAEGDVTGNHLR
jgi:hypothetical protein